MVEKMRHGKMDHAEAVAKNVLERSLPGSRMEYRRSQSNGEHDFDLHHPDGIVEVTCSIDRTLQGTWASILGKDNRGGRIEAQFCKKSWAINPSWNAPISEIRKNVDRYLAAVEEASILRFDGATGSDPSVQRIITDLRVTSGSALPDWIKPTCILIGLPGPAGRIAANTPIEAAEQEARKPDNRRKLGARIGVGRHLAVYAPITSLASFALVDFEPPQGVANLPPEVSDVRIFTESGRTREYVMWRSSTASRWQKSVLAL